MPAVLRCQCGNVLAVAHPDGWEIRHRGREIVAAALVQVVCEDCGATTRPAVREPASVA